MKVSEQRSFGPEGLFVGGWREFGLGEHLQGPVDVASLGGARGATGFGDGGQPAKRRGDLSRGSDAIDRSRLVQAFLFFAATHTVARRHAVSR